MADNPMANDHQQRWVAVGHESTKTDGQENLYLSRLLLDCQQYQEGDELELRISGPLA
jgi:hypothetical protein